MASKAQRKRRRWVRAAHRLGLTFEGYKFVRAGGQRSLAERTQESLREQAEREMKASYGPVEQTFTRREQQIKDLDAKNQADEAAFQGWLVGEQNRIVQEQQNRNASARALIEGQQAALVKQASDLAQERIQRNQQIGGATAPPSAVVDTTVAASGAAAARGLSSFAKREVGATDLTAATAANNLGYIAAKRSERQAKTLEMMAEVAEGRNKAALQQAADHNRRVAQLLEGEVQKAQLRIASNEFSQKLSLDLREEAGRGRGRSITRRGQKEVTNRENAKVNKWGYTNAEWKRMLPGQRQSIMKEQSKWGDRGSKSKKAGGLTSRQRAAARSTIGDTKAMALGHVPPPTPNGATKPLPRPPRRPKPGEALRFSLWLQRNWRVPKNLADIVAWELAYQPRGKGGKYPRGIQRRFDQYAATLPQ